MVTDTAATHINTNNKHENKQRISLHMISNTTSYTVSHLQPGSLHVADLKCDHGVGELGDVTRIDLAIAKPATRLSNHVCSGCPDDEIADAEVRFSPDNSAGNQNLVDLDHATQLQSTSRPNFYSKCVFKRVVACNVMLELSFE